MVDMKDNLGLMSMVVVVLVVVLLVMGYYKKI